MKVKICGITNEQAMYSAMDADALGFVFYERSKRAVNIDQAQNLVNKMPAFIQSVGLFVDAQADFIHAVLKNVYLDLLQFHGDESAEFCRQFGKKWIKSVPMRNFSSQTEVKNYCDRYPDANGFLFDACGAGVVGGSGEIFNWQNIPKISKPIILAGGLNPDNIAEAIKIVRPYAVDVSSGVENETGHKCSVKISRFIQNAQAAKLS